MTIDTLGHRPRFLGGELELRQNHRKTERTGREWPVLGVRAEGGGQARTSNQMLEGEPDCSSTRHAKATGSICQRGSRDLTHLLRRSDSHRAQRSVPSLFAMDLRQLQAFPGSGGTRWFHGCRPGDPHGAIQHLNPCGASRAGARSHAHRPLHRPTDRGGRGGSHESSANSDGAGLAPGRRVLATRIAPGNGPHRHHRHNSEVADTDPGRDRGRPVPRHPSRRRRWHHPGHRTPASRR